MFRRVSRTVWALALLCAGWLPARAELLQAVPDSALLDDRIGVPIIAPRGADARFAFVTGVQPVLRQVAVAVPPGPDNGQHGVFEHELVYALAPDNGPTGTEPPFFVRLVDVGPMPRGTHHIRLIGQVDGVTVVERQVLGFSVTERSVGREDLSGWWYAPEQDGRGLFVSTHELVGDASGQPGYAFLWATHDGDGEAAWVLMVADEVAASAAGTVFSGEAFFTRGAPPASGAAQLAEQRWGRLRFTYAACGRATLAWEAEDPRIVDGEIEMGQLVMTRGARSCAPRGEVVAGRRE
ncbi:hypothetical protein [Pseudomarimonas salicorniae]|uniref:Uncharacterized protein n=1 Tax=Pseudomarimonas salicorniae TaxID=2933270 RepID=A0ABT0GGQ3_9GAMM|nr:hypothetical protein [Lysobacter sp. CAU 1642]MCK7593722.1 hypothetical protein [Lysobacter sp. CAU 1642]